MQLLYHFTSPDRAKSIRAEGLVRSNESEDPEYGGILFETRVRGVWFVGNCIERPESTFYPIGIDPETESREDSKLSIGFSIRVSEMLEKGVDYSFYFISARPRPGSEVYEERSYAICRKGTPWDAILRRRCETLCGSEDPNVINPSNCRLLTDGQDEYCILYQENGIQNKGVWRFGALPCNVDSRPDDFERRVLMNDGPISKAGKDNPILNIFLCTDGEPQSCIPLPRFSEERDFQVKRIPPKRIDDPTNLSPLRLRKQGGVWVREHRAPRAVSPSPRDIVVTEPEPLLDQHGYSIPAPGGPQPIERYLKKGSFEHNDEVIPRKPPAITYPFQEPIQEMVAATERKVRAKLDEVEEVPQLPTPRGFDRNVNLTQLSMTRGGLDANRLRRRLLGESPPPLPDVEAVRRVEKHPPPGYGAHDVPTTMTERVYGVELHPEHPLRLAQEKVSQSIMAATQHYERQEQKRREAPQPKRPPYDDYGNYLPQKSPPRSPRCAGESQAAAVPQEPVAPSTRRSSPMTMTRKSSPPRETGFINTGMSGFVQSSSPRVRRARESLQARKEYGAAVNRENSRKREDSRARVREHSGTRSILKNSAGGQSPKSHYGSRAVSRATINDLVSEVGNSLSATDAEVNRINNPGQTDQYGRLKGRQDTRGEGTTFPVEKKQDLGIPKWQPPSDEVYKELGKGRRAEESYDVITGGGEGKYGSDSFGMLLAKEAIAGGNLNTSAATSVEANRPLGVAINPSYGSVEWAQGRIGATDRGNISLDEQSRALAGEGGKHNPVSGYHSTLEIPKMLDRVYSPKQGSRRVKSCHFCKGPVPCGEFAHGDMCARCGNIQYTRPTNSEEWKVLVGTKKKK